MTFAAAIYTSRITKQNNISPIKTPKKAAEHQIITLVIHKGLFAGEKRRNSVFGSFILSDILEPISMLYDQEHEIVNLVPVLVLLSFRVGMRKSPSMSRCIRAVLFFCD
ncbi:hypothetical protein CDAR_193791 [Caerostris darwini]|uniref:Uncharacterized protein n=1 Tax=Caerostris darwini TaxID=1538125 RepID=A0AAV4UPA2_9ARAC|nr:hypothetical protein CDAR_193791 [Caerostris darwini]